MWRRGPSGDLDSRDGSPRGARVSPGGASAAHASCWKADRRFLSSSVRGGYTNTSSESHTVFLNRLLSTVVHQRNKEPIPTANRVHKERVAGLVERCSEMMIAKWHSMVPSSQTSSWPVSWAGNMSIPWMYPSRRRSRPCPSVDPVQRILSRPCKRAVEG